MKLLIVDDAESNIGVLSLLIEEWVEDHDIDFDEITLDKAYNGKEGFEKIQQTDYDLVFLDIMMPVMDGLEALKLIRKTPLDKQPTIIMQTALGDARVKHQAKSLGANAYITKPVDSVMINAMMDRYIILPNNKEEEDEFEEFDDFEDFDDFDDFDDFESDEIDTQKDMMTKFNESHKKIPASEFLEDYPDLTYILEDVEDIDHQLIEIIEHLDEDNIEENMELLENILDNYARFLNTFMDFYELATSLKILLDVLHAIEFAYLDPKNRQFIANFLIAILKDLQDWKEHVFVAQDAIDVFYINASALNSCIQLESYIKSNTKKED